MKLRDKYGWPAERIIGKPITNFIRLILHTNLKQTWQRRNTPPAPPVQERERDKALEDLPQIRYVATRGEPEPSGYYVPIKEAKKVLAIAVKDAREQAAKIAEDCDRWRIPREDIAEAIRQSAAQPAPQEEK